MDVSADDIKVELLDALEKDQLVLPTLPEIALKVREAAHDPLTDIKRLQELLGSDAALSARVVRVANSPLVRGYQTIEHLQAALSRLGVTYSCNLVMGLAMEQMFQATNEFVDEKLRQVWSRGAEVAAIANVLAQHYTKLEPDKATLAGLTHEIGVLPILTYAEEHEELLEPENSALLDRVIREVGPELGVRILQSWKFHPALAMVPVQHLNYRRNSAATDYVDVVIVARLQSYGYEDIGDESPDWQHIPAFNKLGLEISEESMELTGINEEEIDLAAVALQ
ncbi:MAG: HDOD domain-containing protein [Pseudomonadales bacterium]|nr:HDOD domain-containing protein [Pseudomonadales bacterium]